MGLPWFRMYAEAVDDEKLRLLAFEDRWHFVALLCMKSQGVLDERDEALLRRKVAVKLGLAGADADEVKRRLMEVSLIDERWAPIAWNKRQFASDYSTLRVRNWREKHRETLQKRCSNGEVTAQDTDTDTDKEKKKKREVTRAGRSQPTRLLIGNLPETWAAYCKQKRPELDPAAVWENFRDYWTAKGNDATKVDWSAAWRMWVRKERDGPQVRAAEVPWYKQIANA